MMGNEGDGRYYGIINKILIKKIIIIINIIIKKRRHVAGSYQLPQLLERCSHVR